MLDVVSAMAVDDAATLLAVGDTGGHVRVYDLAAGIDTASSASARAGFKQVRCGVWRSAAASAACAPLQLLPALLLCWWHDECVGHATALPRCPAACALAGA